jgi:hypothetical protein
MELKATNHRYYSSETNYYVNGYENFGRYDCETWEDFKCDWLDSNGEVDDDYNHVFRFDIKQKTDDEENEIEDFELWLFFILQRKGIYRPVHIKTITKEDMPEIERFLSDRWNYMKNQWSEFSS